MSHYLNYSSTNAPVSGELNPSDIGYSQNVEKRIEYEELASKIKKYVGADVSSRVIINSGATESIANCMFWANKYGCGKVLGSKFDHSSVIDNANLYDIDYDDSFKLKELKNGCSMLFLTHVDSKTGEIMDVDNVISHVSTMKLIYKPVIVLDVSQSIGKIQIHMKKWKINALFFSMHKLGGSIGSGILVVDDFKEAPYIPLIAGKQQAHLRGGTFPLSRVLIDSNLIFEMRDDIEERKTRWNKAVSQFKNYGIKVYEPKSEHLYNTILLLIDNITCPLRIINELAENEIYVGNISACANEDSIYGSDVDKSIEYYKSRKNNTKNMTGGDGTAKIRISFRTPKDINKKIVKTISETILQYVNA